MREIKFFLIALAILFAGFMLAARIKASQEDKVYWCHCEPNGNCQTLHLPLQALENAGHVNADGNPLHAGDHVGECVEPIPTQIATPSATLVPTIEPTATPVPVISPTEAPDGESPSPTPAPTGVTETPHPQPCNFCGGEKVGAPPPDEPDRGFPNYGPK